MINSNRRKFLTGLVGLIAAPAIVHAANIMPVKQMGWVPIRNRVDWTPERLRVDQYGGTWIRCDGGPIDIPSDLNRVLGPVFNGRVPDLRGSAPRGLERWIKAHGPGPDPLGIVIQAYTSSPFKKPVGYNLGWIRS